MADREPVFRVVKVVELQLQTLTRSSLVQWFN